MGAKDVSHEGGEGINIHRALHLCWEPPSTWDNFTLNPLDDENPLPITEGDTKPCLHQ